MGCGILNQGDATTMEKAPAKEYKFLKPTKIGGLQLQTSVVRTATQIGLCEQDTGFARPALFNVYKSLAAGKLGMITIETSYISQEGWSGSPQLGIQSDEHIEQHKKLVNTIKEVDNKNICCLSISHAGRVSGGEERLDLDKLSQDQILKIVSDFKDAAKRAKTAGYQIVELVCAHEQLLECSISASFNGRKDRFAAKDFGLLKLVLNECKSVGIAVGVVLTVDDIDRAVQIVQQLDFDYVEVTGAKYAHEQSFKYKSQFKKLVADNLHKKQPIIVTGGFVSVQQMQEAFDQGVTAIGLSRQLLRDDHFLVNLEKSKACTRCNQCITAHYKGQICYVTRVEEGDKYLNMGVDNEDLGLQDIAKVKEKLLSAIPLTKALKLKNRVVRSAVCINSSQEKTGIPNQECFDQYAQEAAGKPGMFIVERTYPSDRGRTGHKGQLGIHNDDMIEHHKKIVSAIKTADPNIITCLQISHSGNVGREGNVLDISKASVDEINQAISEFKDACVRAQKSGYQCIQIQASHGFLISQSLNKANNQRSDEYKVENFELLKQIFKNAKVTGLPVGIKINTSDFHDDGIEMELVIKIIQTLDLDFVEISGGGFDPRSQKVPWRTGDENFYYKDAFSKLKALNLHKKQPLIVTGGFRDIEGVKEAFGAGVELIGFGRQFLRDPKFLLNLDGFKRCIRCNQCVVKLESGESGVCQVTKAEKEMFN